MIPAPVIEQGWLPLFLPYVALLDDPVLKLRCTLREDVAPADFDFSAADTDAAADARDQLAENRATNASACLRTLWEVRVDGVV